MNAVLELVADLAPFRQQIADLRSLWLEAGEIPQPLLDDLHALVDNAGDEIAFECDAPASGATQHVITIRFREGGEFDRCADALRVLTSARS